MLKYIFTNFNFIRFFYRFLFFLFFFIVFFFVCLLLVFFVFLFFLFHFFFVILFVILFFLIIFFFSNLCIFYSIKAIQFACFVSRIKFSFIPFNLIASHFNVIFNTKIKINCTVIINHIVFINIPIHFFFNSLFPFNGFFCKLFFKRFNLCFKLRKILFH